MFALVLAACGTSTDGATADGAPTTPSYLFVFDGTSAEMRPIAGSSGTYAFAVDLGCTMVDECAPVVWFADRPVRDSGALDIRRFAALWSLDDGDGFRMDPPNVAIEVSATTTGTGRPSTIVATMSDTTLARTADRGTIVLVATMSLVPSERFDEVAPDGEHLAVHTERAMSSIPTDLGDVTVFVDPEIGLSSTDLYDSLGGSWGGNGGNGGNGASGLLSTLGSRYEPCSCG